MENVLFCVKAAVVVIIITLIIPYFKNKHKEKKRRRANITSFLITIRNWDASSLENDFSPARIDSLITKIIEAVVDGYDRAFLRDCAEIIVKMDRIYLVDKALENKDLKSRARKKLEALKAEINNEFRVKFDKELTITYEK